VPLAIPCLAGPSAIATVMLLMGQEPHRWYEWVVSLLLAWILTSSILLLSAKLDRILGEKGMSALQHLMGLILTALAVEMFIQGLHAAFNLQI
jgi:multiple antibiotic resistance protein